MQEILNKIKSVKLCLMAHPDNQEDSEFEDRILDLIDIEHELQKSSYSEEEVKKIAFNFYYDMSNKMGVFENLISENATNVDVWLEQFKKKQIYENRIRRSC